MGLESRLESMILIIAIIISSSVTDLLFLTVEVE